MAANIVDQNISRTWARFDSWPISSHLWLVILVAFLAFSVQVWMNGDRLPGPAAISTVEHAVALHRDGVFGYAAKADVMATPAMYFTPAYAAFAAGAMGLDESLAKSLYCLASVENTDKTTACANNLRPFFFVQALILALVPFFAWLTAWQLSGRKAFAWGAGLLVLLSGRPALHATSFSADVFTLPLFAALLLSLVVAIQSRFWLWFTAIGLTCGLLALSEPIYVWLFYGLLPVMAYWRADHEQNSRWFWIAAGTMALPYLLVTAPWIARNWFLFDTAVLSQGQVATLLAERLAWNGMTALEIAVSLVYSLGGIGPDLAASAYPEEGWRRLIPANPDGLLQAGQALASQIQLAPVAIENQTAWLFAEKVWPDIGKHMGVTLALVWRGIWIGGYWSLIIAPLALAYGAVCISRSRTDIVMPLSVCGFMLFLFAFISTGDPAGNDILIPMFSVLAALLGGEWARHKFGIT